MYQDYSCSIMIAERLRAARTKAQLTRTQLAARSEVNTGTIADIEEGRNRNPSYDKVVRLARSLGVSPEQLYPIEFQPRQVA